MIPKIIHYCWFGRNPLPPLAKKCIESWRTFLPEYEIREWNEDNFDINSITYTREAYEAKKYAFVSDYARFWVLYKYGGLYFDTDVEIIRNIDDIISRGPFMGCENEAQDVAATIGVAPGLGLGMNPGQGLLKELLSLYSTLSFINPDGTYNQKTVVDYTTELLCKHGLVSTNSIQEVIGINIFPKDYFCPIDQFTGEMKMTDNTRSIHHYMASWITKSQRLYQIVEKLFGFRFAQFLSKKLKKMGLFK